jgi:hypothetical protein
MGFIIQYLIRCAAPCAENPAHTVASIERGFG